LAASSPMLIESAQTVQNKSNSELSPDVQT
jgi:hypothetical protein